MAKTTSTTTTKKDIKLSAVIQFQGAEFTEAECLKKAEAQFKKENKGVELTDITIYIKPEEHTVYYVANGDKAGSVAL